MFHLLILFLVIWQVLASINVINTFLFSSPFDVCQTAFNLFVKENLLYHIFITTIETLISFLLSFGIGFVISSVMWWNTMFSRVIDPYITILNSLPKVALGPLIIIWVGASINSIIFMALLISTFITIINLYNYFYNTNSDYITLFKSFNASKRQTFFNVVIPSNYLNIISVLKINISMNLIGVIMGELLVSKAGLGYLIMYGSQVFNINLVITSVVILGIISYLLYFIICCIEKRVSKY